MIAAILAVVFFLPLAFIYGRHRARQLKAAGGTPGSRLASLVPIPALFLVCAIIAVIFEGEKGAADRLALQGVVHPGSVLDTGNGVTDFLLRIARWIGELELILFMVTIPFIMGAIVAAVLLVLDARGTIVLPQPGPPEVPDLPTQRARLATGAMGSKDGNERDA